MRFLIRLDYELESKFEPWELFTARLKYTLIRLFSPLSRARRRVTGRRQRLYIRLEHKFGNLKLLILWFLSITAIAVLMTITSGDSPSNSSSATPTSGAVDSVLTLVVKGFLVLFGTYLVILTLRSVPRIGQVALPDSRRALKRLGNWNYGISGVVSAFLVANAYVYKTQTPPLNDRLFDVVAGIAVLVNSLAVNYCIRQWDYVISAQRDVGKLLFRVAILLLIACLAVAINARSISNSVGSGLSILFVPLSLEAAFVVHKSR